MTVDELIAKLAPYPGDYQVLVNKDDFAGGSLGSRFKGDWPIEVVPGHYDGSGYRGKKLSRFVASVGRSYNCKYTKQPGMSRFDSATSDALASGSMT